MKLFQSSLKNQSLNSTEVTDEVKERGFSWSNLSNK